MRNATHKVAVAPGSWADGLQARALVRTCATAAMAVGLGILAGIPDASALWDDKLELVAAQSVIRDDNVFRIFGDRDPEMVLGSSSSGDTYYKTAFGINFDIPVSAQRFAGDLTLSDNRYDRFGGLDHDARSGRVSWYWQAGRRFRGQLGYSEDSFLASFTNLQSGTPSSTANFLKINETVLSAVYRAAPRWEVSSDFKRSRHLNSAAGFQTSDASIEEVTLTTSYVTPSGNRAGLRIRSEDADLWNPQLVGDVAIDNSYMQRRIAAVLEWGITGQSRLNVELGRVARTYGQLPQRDFDDLMLYAVYEWTPTAKFMLRASARHDVSRSEQVNVGFVFVEGITLQPIWRLTEKMDLTLSFERSDRNHRGDPALDALDTVSNLSERVHAATIAAVYRPTPLLRVSAALRREARDSAEASADYEAEIASLEVRVAF